MHSYLILYNENIEDEAEAWRAVADRFDRAAFVMGALWSLLNRLWALSAFIISAAAAIFYIQYLGLISITSAFLCLTLLYAFVGFAASDCQVSRLQRLGYKAMGIVYAPSYEYAMLKFLSKYNEENVR